MPLFVLYHNEAYMGGTEAAIDSVIEAPNAEVARRIAELRGSWLRVEEIDTATCPLVRFPADAEFLRAREGKKAIDEAYAAMARIYFERDAPKRAEYMAKIAEIREKRGKK